MIELTAKSKLMAAFPGLRISKFKITSDETDQYNCIAWAAEDTQHFWWPFESPHCYWPKECPRIVELDIFIAAFGTLGYSVCQDGIYENGFIKIAIFAKDDGIPTHAARQLLNGKWTSKCGRYKDIEHDLNALCGPHPAYGNVVCYMKKPV